MQKVIEYNGEKFHPREDMIEQEWEEWRQVYTNKTANQVKEEDRTKIQKTMDNGYQVMIVWDEEYKKEPEKVLERCLSFLRK